MTTAFIIGIVLFVLYYTYNYSDKNHLKAINFIQSHVDNCLDVTVAYTKSKEFNFFFKPHKAAVITEFQKFFEKMLSGKVGKSSSFEEALDILNYLRKKDRGTTIIPSNMVGEMLKKIISQNIKHLTYLAQKYLDEKGYVEINLLATYCRLSEKEEEKFSEPQKWQVITLVCFQYPEIKVVLQTAFDKLKAMTQEDVASAIGSESTTDEKLAELTQRSYISNEDRAKLIDKLKHRKKIIQEYFKNIPDFEKNLARSKFLESLHILKENTNGTAKLEIVTDKEDFSKKEAV